MTKNARSAADVERLADLEAALVRRQSQLDQLRQLHLARKHLADFEDFVTERRRKLARAVTAAEAAAREAGALELLPPPPEPEK
jgi:septal ring factor EnvC (AmiA/AmiB activator)